MAKTTVPGLYIADGAITAAKLSSTLDLSGVTITVATASTGDSDTSVASTAFVQQEIAALVDSSPSALNTLNELAAAIGDDASFSTTVTNSIATKLPLAGGTLTGNLIINTTGSIQIPVGTTAQRPTAAQGQLRFNTTTSKPEIYSGSAWTDVGGGVESVNSATGVVVLTTANIAENTNLYYTDARADARIAAADTDDLSEGSTNLYFTTARANSAFDGRLSGSTGVTVSNGAVSIGQDVATSTSPTFQNLTLSGTNSIKVPSGTTAQRSGSPANGMLRYNSSTNEFEGYADSAWGAIGGDTTSSVDLYTATGNGSTATYDTGKNPQSENNTWVFVGGVYQPKSTYSFSGTQITLSENLPNGEDLEVITGTVSTYNPTDAILGQYNVTTSNTASYNTSLTTENENNVFVFVDGVYQPKSSYTYSGSTLTLDAVPTSGMSLEVLVTRSMNAATVTTGFLADDAVTTVKILDANVTAGKLASSLDLTGKTVTVATASAGDNDTSVASTAFVRQEITSLVDSAPAAMDTLNELAAALGDDANFSTTVNNSIALKAPLASPTFTGTAEIPNLTVGGQQGTDGQLLTSTGSGIAWEDAPAALTFKTFGTSSIMIGDSTTGTINAADYNTGLGINVFENLTTGDKNTAVGYYSMGGKSSGNMTGTENTAIGNESLPRITSGQHNTAVGAYSGEYLSTGQGNTYVGYYAGYQNFTGSFNTAMGRTAFFFGDGSHNVAIGRRTLQNNGTKNYNTALGNYALSSVSTGEYNTGLGYEAGRYITTGSKNVVIGSYDGNENGLDIRTSSNNIVLSDGDSNIRMVINSSGNVGIGTSTPTYLLDTESTTTGLTHNLKLNKSSTTGDYAEIAFQLWDGAGTGLNTFGGSGDSRPSVVLRAVNEATNSAAGAFVVGTFTGGASNSTLTEKFRIASDGKVGIGTSTIPHGGIGRAKFAINGTNADAQGPHLQYTTDTDDYPVFQQLNWSHDNISLNFDSYFDGVWRSSDAGSNFQIYKNVDLFSIKYDSGINPGDGVSWNDGFVIDTAGKVGIGETSPLGKLHVKSADSGAGADAGADELVVEGSGDSGLSILSGTSNNGTILFSDSGDSAAGGLRYEQNNNALNFRTNGAWNRLYINSSGNVGIGETDPQTKLHIFGTDPVIRVSDDSTSGFSTLELRQQNTATEGFEISYNSGSGHTHLNNIYALGSGGDMIFATSTNSFGTTTTNRRLAIKADGIIEVGKSNVGSDIIKFMGTTNVGAPNTSNHNTGTRLSLYDSGTNSWYAIGVESNTMWFHTDGNYNFYQDNVRKVQFDGSAPMPVVRAGPSASNAMRLGSVTTVLPYSGIGLIVATSGAAITVHDSTNNATTWENLSSNLPDYLLGTATFNTINTSSQANPIVYLNVATKVYLVRDSGWNSVSLTGWTRLSDENVYGSGTSRVYVQYLHAGTHSLDNNSALYFFEAPIGP